MGQTEDVVSREGQENTKKRPRNVPFFRGKDRSSLTIDQAVSLLASSQRRRLLVALVTRAPRDVSLGSVIDDLAEADAPPEKSATKARHAVRVSLLHNHLPKLEEAGVVTYHKESDSLTYHRDPTLETLLKRIIELKSKK